MQFCLDRASHAPWACHHRDLAVASANSAVTEHIRAVTQNDHTDDTGWHLLFTCKHKGEHTGNRPKSALQIYKWVLGLSTHLRTLQQFMLMQCWPNAAIHADALLAKTSRLVGQVQFDPCRTACTLHTPRIPANRLSTKMVGVLSVPGGSWDRQGIKGLSFPVTVDGSRLTTLHALTPAERRKLQSGNSRCARQNNCALKGMTCGGSHASAANSCNSRRFLARCRRPSTTLHDAVASRHYIGRKSAPWLHSSQQQ